MAPATAAAWTARSRRLGSPESSAPGEVTPSGSNLRCAWVRTYLHAVSLRPVTKAFKIFSSKRWAAPSSMAFSSWSSMTFRNMAFRCLGPQLSTSEATSLTGIRLMMCFTSALRVDLLMSLFASNTPRSSFGGSVSPALALSVAPPSPGLASSSSSNLYTAAIFLKTLRVVSFTTWWGKACTNAAAPLSCTSAASLQVTSNRSWSESFCICCNTSSGVSLRVCRITAFESASASSSAREYGLAGSCTSAMGLFSPSCSST
mmetsp:Transcript_76239/g.163551  ORF Transcript_76239/g.163551 Transcript_76239/m.163551 type:complete len:260 (-) Transcript_76239:862-1641(-)